jgi:hypothetical protein
LEGKQTESDRWLSVTVGRQFADGIKASVDDQILTPEDIHTKIRFLTNMADQFLESGASEKAFESLMKAYLLDPLSPYVMASEKTILPAWESTKNNSPRSSLQQEGTLLSDRYHDMSNTGSMNMARSTPGLNSSPDHHSSRPGPLPQPGDDQLRVELLRQQKEQERQEKERAVWREASRPPKVFGEDDTLNGASEQQQTPEKPKQQPTGLFSRLRLGKFLE